VNRNLKLRLIGAGVGFGLAVEFFFFLWLGPPFYMGSLADYVEGYFLIAFAPSLFVLSQVGLLVSWWACSPAGNESDLGKEDKW
jgi:hypothetical protein